MTILALSSSRTGNLPYLSTGIKQLESCIGSYKRIAFVPFASVTDHIEYADKVRDALQHLDVQIEMVTIDTAQKVIGEAEVIIIGGGNTFKLLHDIYASKVYDLIKQKVQGGTPYIGWSAGSNLCGLTISTTNDMPIIEPESFKAFGFFPFQINPHYINISMPGFNGETRDHRLEEFLRLNQEATVVGLPEGTALVMEDDSVVYKGKEPGVLFNKNGKKLIENDERI